MRYWDEDQPDWGAAEHDFAVAWRRLPKWVVSTSLESAGPNATVISQDVEQSVRQLKEQQAGVLEVGGTVLARHLTEWGLIDEYRIYLAPVVLGSGTPFFNGFRPRLRLVDSRQVGQQNVLLTYEPERA